MKIYKYTIDNNKGCPEERRRIDLFSFTKFRRVHFKQIVENIIEEMSDDLLDIDEIGKEICRTDDRFFQLNTEITAAVNEYSCCKKERGVAYVQ